MTRLTAIAVLALLGVAQPSRAFTFTINTLTCTQYSYSISLTAQEFSSAYSTNFIIDDGTPNEGNSFGAFGFVGGSMGLVKQVNTAYTDSGTFPPNAVPVSAQWRVGMVLQDASSNAIAGGSSLRFISNPCGQRAPPRTTSTTSSATTTIRSSTTATPSTAISVVSTSILSSASSTTIVPTTIPFTTTQLSSTSLSTTPIPVITSPVPPTPTPISHNHTGAIVGAVVGVLALVAAAAAVLFVLARRRRKAKQAPHGDDFFAADANAGTIEKGYGDGDEAQPDDPEDAADVVAALPRQGDVQQDTSSASVASPRPDNPLFVNTERWSAMAT